MGEKSVVQLMGHGMEKCCTTHDPWEGESVVQPMGHGKKVAERCAYHPSHCFHQSCTWDQELNDALPDSQLGKTLDISKSLKQQLLTIACIDHGSGFQLGSQQSL